MIRDQGSKRQLAGNRYKALDQASGRAHVRMRAHRESKPVIKGTRVSVEIVIGSLACGMDIKEVADEYGLEREDILATIECAIKR